MLREVGIILGPVVIPMDCLADVLAPFEAGGPGFRGVAMPLDRQEEAMAISAGLITAVIAPIVPKRAPVPTVGVLLHQASGSGSRLGAARVMVASDDVARGEVVQGATAQAFCDV